MAKWQVDVTDSGRDVDVSNHKYMVVTYEPSWHGIRLGLSFKSYEEVHKSIAMCQVYMDRAPSVDESLRRILRVRNLLIAIPVYDWRQQADSADLIQQTSLRLNALIDESDKHLVWDWNVARTQAYSMHTNAHGVFNLMHKQLRARRNRTSGPKVELHYFLDILNEVIDASSNS